MKNSEYLLIASFTLLLLLPSGAICSPPDFTKGDKIPEGATHDWNLGPTGVRGWIYSNKMDTTEARQIYITKVDAKSPADKILEVGDVILGVFNKNFSYDPRTEFGKAITKAEAKDGQLPLLVWRDGKILNKIIKLKVMGEYSATAPFNCKKSTLILKQGLKALADKIKKNPNSDNMITQSYNALALLASGKKGYQSLAQKECEILSRKLSNKNYKTWHYGPANILLAEYTLAKKSPKFMKDLERITMEIVRGQSDAGSWGHGFKKSDGRLGGYGMMNAPGLPLTISLVLARKAGIKNAELDQAITKSSNLLRFYVGKGSVPYGDHDPWMETHEDNGKNGAAAVLYNLLDDKNAAQFFSRMCTAAHGAERDMGHTGNFFNILWAMPGVALSGQNATGSWMKEFGWYYDLARRWDGTFSHLGPPQNKPDSYNNWDATGIYLLAYEQPLKQIYLTGEKSDLIKPVSKTEAEQLVATGRGWLLRNKNTCYKELSDTEVLNRLKGWSPTVRERCATEMKRRKNIKPAQLVEMLKSDDINAKLGACEALKRVKISNKEEAVKELKKNLDSKNLWVRIKAAQALMQIGQPSKEVIEKLLRRIIDTDFKSDPRAMESRYLCFLLFKRGGAVSKNIKNIDRQLLLKAVKAGLSNENGQSRGKISSIYQILSFEELKPILPAIKESIIVPAPSGIMFASQIRVEGLNLLAKNHVREGMKMIVDYAKNQNQWASQKRIIKLMDMLEKYGANAKEQVPDLKKLAEWCKTEKGFPKWARKEKAQAIEAAIKRINASLDKPKLINMNKLNK